MGMFGKVLAVTGGVIFGGSLGFWLVDYYKTNVLKIDRAAVTHIENNV
jgi:hypothetical protein